MKKIFTSVFVLVMGAQLYAQTETKIKEKLTKKANDHFMLQFTADSWMNKPDSIVTKGIGRGANIYLMMNYPFKTNEKFSAAIGVGFGTSGIYLNKQSVQVAGQTQNLVFNKLDSTNHFKKYKFAATYLEIPVELRYTQNPDNADKSWKFAIGAKVGTTLDAHTKGKNLVDKNNTAVNNYTEKIKQKRYLNNSRIALTGRLGWGHFSVFAQYQVTSLFKDTQGPDVHPFSIGLALSGL